MWAGTGTGAPPRCARLILQVVEDEAVGRERGDTARLALGDVAHLVGVLALLRWREAVEAQAVAASEYVVSEHRRLAALSIR